MARGDRQVAGARSRLRLGARRRVGGGKRCPRLPSGRSAPHDARRRSGHRSLGLPLGQRELAFRAQSGGGAGERRLSGAGAASGRHTAARTRRAHCGSRRMAPRRAGTRLQHGVGTPGQCSGRSNGHRHRPRLLRPRVRPSLLRSLGASRSITRPDASLSRGDIGCHRTDGHRTHRRGGPTRSHPDLPEFRHVPGVIRSRRANRRLAAATSQSQAPGFRISLVAVAFALPVQREIPPEVASALALLRQHRPAHPGAGSRVASGRLHTRTPESLSPAFTCRSTRSS